MQGRKMGSEMETKHNLGDGGVNHEGGADKCRRVKTCSKEKGIFAGYGMPNTQAINKRSGRNKAPVHCFVVM